MIELVRGEARLPATAERVWRLLEDPSALQRVLPGAESVVAAGDGRFDGVIATRLQFITVRADVTTRFEDVDRPRHATIVMEGRPRGLAGSFKAAIPFEIDEVIGSEKPPTAAITYRIELVTTGRLASFGAPLFRDIARRQIAVLFDNVRDELERDPAGEAP